MLLRAWRLAHIKQDLKLVDNNNNNNNNDNNIFTVIHVPETGMRRQYKVKVEKYKHQTCQVQVSKGTPMLLINEFDKLAVKTAHLCKARVNQCKLQASYRERSYKRRWVEHYFNGWLLKKTRPLTWTYLIPCVFIWAFQQTYL